MNVGNEETVDGAEYVADINMGVAVLSAFGGFFLRVFGREECSWVSGLKEIKRRGID